MAPGETVKVVLDEEFATIPLTRDSLFDRMDQEFFGPFRGDEVGDGAVNAGALSGFTRQFRESRATGRILALGWTRTADAPMLSHTGEPIDRGRTGFMTLEPIVHNANPSVDYGESSAILQRLWEFELNDRVNGFAEFPSEILYTLPADADPEGDYVVELSDDVVALDIWNGSSWDPSSENRIPGTSAVPLLPDALRGGQVHLRAGFGSFDRTSIPVIRSATAEEIAARP